MFRVIIALCGSLLLAGQLSAQSVTAEKKEEAQTLFQDPYATLQMRHYAKRYYENDEVTGTTPYLQPRLYLGSYFLNKKLHAYFLLRAEKHTQSNQFQTIAPVFYSEYEIAKGFLGETYVYNELYMKAHDNDHDWAWTGAYYKTPDFKASTALGEFSIYGRTDVAAMLVGNGSEKAEVKGGADEYKLATGLAAEDKAETDKEHPSYQVYSDIIASLKVKGVEGLSIGSGVEYYQVFDPKYVYQADDQNKAELDGYDRSADFTETHVKVSYNLTEKTAISNTIYHYSNGFYKEERKSEDDGFRYLNRVMISHDF